ncbi:AcrR family transcriptional regulator [Amorphus sp. MBR-141]
MATCRGAGQVTKGTVYFYFETKEKLFTEVIRHFTPQLNPPNNPETGDSAEKQLLSYIRFLYSNVAAERTSRELFHLIISEGHHFPDFLDTHFAEFLEPALIRVREILCRGVETGEFRSSRVESFPEIILGPTVLLNIWLVVFGDRKPIDQDMFIDTHLDLLVGGLRVHAASPTREPQG